MEPKRGHHLSQLWADHATDITNKVTNSTEVTLDDMRRAAAAAANKPTAQLPDSVQGRPVPRLQKVCRFQGPKMNPLNMARCCSESNRKISKCGNTFRLHCQILKVQKGNFFSVGNRTYILSYSHFRKLHVCTLFFLYLVFANGCKTVRVVTHIFNIPKWSRTRPWCYAEHGVGWGGDVNVRLKLNTPLMLRWAWGGVGWGCWRSVEVEHATDATLSMGWGGVGMLTFGWSWTFHWCYAEHGVGWGGNVNVRLKLNTPLMLRWASGGVGWGGDINVRLKLNFPLMLRWAWGGVGWGC